MDPAAGLRPAILLSRHQRPGERVPQSPRLHTRLEQTTVKRVWNYLATRRFNWLHLVSVIIIATTVTDLHRSGWSYWKIDPIAIIAYGVVFALGNIAAGRVRGRG